MKVWGPNAVLLAVLAATVVVGAEPTSEVSSVVRTVSGGVQHPGPVQTSSAGSTGTVEDMTLNLVLSRKGGLFRNGYSFSCCGDKDCRNEDVAGTIKARVKRFGHFPVVIRTEVATRPEVSIPVVEMFREFGLSNVQCIATEQTLHELNARPRCRVALTKSVPLTLLSVVLLLALITMGVLVSRWTGRRETESGVAEGGDSHKGWQTRRCIARGVLVSVLLTVVAVYTQSGVAGIVSASVGFQRTLWWMLVGAAGSIGLTRAWKHKKYVPFLVCAVVLLSLGATVGTYWFNPGMGVYQCEVFPGGLQRVTQWVLGPTESLVLIFANDTLIALVLKGETSRIVLMFLTGSIVVNGLLGAWTGLIVCRVKNSPEVVLSGGLVDLGRQTLMAVPFVLPVLFCLLYEPVNLRYTMNVFDWGNHTVDFNVRSVNLILGSLVVCLSWMLLFVGVPFVRGARRSEYLWVGALVVVMLMSELFAFSGV